MRGRSSASNAPVRLRHGRDWESITGLEVEVLPMQRGGFLSWALVFPSDYGTGMSNLGFHYVYYHLKALGVGVERFFNSPIPGVSVETGRPLQDFPVITASIAYEPDALNFLQQLSQAGIPPDRRKRKDVGYPLIGVAGACTSINPKMLISVADFVILGDGEPLIPLLADCAREYSRGGSRERFLEAIDDNPAILVPGLGEEEALTSLQKGLKRFSVTPAGESLGHGVWITPKATFGKTLLLELQRGCFRGCPYCVLPACFSPTRQRPLERVLENLESCASRVPFDQVGLVTPEAGDYPGLDEVLDHLEKLDKGVSFASLRIDNLTRRMLRSLKKSGRQSLTIAPETGSDRLRFLCGKTFTNGQILEKLQMAREEGVKKVKLYFMVGLPGEREEDLLAIAGLSGKIRKDLKMSVSLSVNTFVPKPGTPWERETFSGTRGAGEKFKLLREALSKGLAKGIEARFSSPREADLEYRLSWAGPGDLDWMESLVGKRERRKPNAIRN